MDNSAWNDLFLTLYPNKVEFNANKHLFTKIAFDVFQFNASPAESLWTLEDGDDGKQYLVANYDSDAQLEATGDWNVLTNKSATAATLTYKNYPVHQFNSSEYGFSPEEMPIFMKTLFKKANSDALFVGKVVLSQPQEKQEELKRLFPELF